jgi:FdhD protein
VTSRVAITAIRRQQGTSAQTDQDLVAVEAPLTIIVRGAGQPDAHTLGVVMRTPGDDRDLVLGLLHSESLLSTRTDVVALAFGGSSDDGETADVTLAESIDLGGRVVGRGLAATSACGLCGRLAIDHVDALARRTTASTSTATWDAALISDLPARLRAEQTVFAETGGLHAAALVDADGTLLTLREDVGRHNAVDKLVGAALDDGRLPARDTLVVVSGRVAYEIVQKAAMAGVAGIVAVGAPSGLAIDAARATGLTLIGFTRNGRFNVYTGDARVRR